MPRRKMTTRQAKGLLLVRPYEPNKSNIVDWEACSRNDDLIHVLLAGEPHMLDGAHDFANEQERREAWERNCAMIMGLKSDGWDPNEGRGGLRRIGYVVGNRPWAYMHYDLKIDLPPKWPVHFDQTQFEYLRDHNLLEEGERELVTLYLQRMKRPAVPAGVEEGED